MVRVMECIVMTGGEISPKQEMTDGNVLNPGIQGKQGWMGARQASRVRATQKTQSVCWHKEE